MNKNHFLEDKQLLSAIRIADKNAYAFLFKKYYPILCAYGNKFIELKDAEEIVQDVMLWLWENRTTLQIETSLSQYLFRSVYHRAMNRLESKQAQNRADTLFYEQMQEMLQDTDYYQIEELTKRIKEAIDKLPESYRESFVMHRFQNMSYKEIGTQLGISHKTVDYRIQQALKLLRIELKDYLPIILPFLMY
ncbi:RNA polymerase sigma-70 factor [Parabacteroides gordonii]|jgi:RNA polymerase sigma-70 factor (ECF subfamily)|uniref:RNA polymerase sigma-70 factor n=1 Tax=Parabacteroides gordonii MS-1 = DSM 23371 TaxID=1203610 RepID=A0A0F5JJB0_9BACT|nr:RNA polymerase sigma-70 factor [Parabacteroides gordonii]KKB57906.1 RNA polymerase sigma-70 factor [Parabacteroides gordonii MS-1 = DSM 23371]MCA5582904.1 RNA polymerase sigma-70 factor [Parabacteroides gordonii]RGP11165.1 RNA polymerase sigma-70 factor [Parabacteroides gordonii]